MSKTFVSGQEILERWKCEDWQLLQAIRSGHLIPYHRALLEPYKIKSNKPGEIIYHVSGRDPLSLKYEELLPILPTCLFLNKTVEELEKSRPGLRKSTEPGLELKKKVDDPDEIIRLLRAEGVTDPDIAAELHDKKLLTYKQIAEKFDQANDLNKDQHDAIKGRGRAFVLKGKKLNKN